MKPRRSYQVGCVWAMALIYAVAFGGIAFLARFDKFMTPLFTVAAIVLGAEPLWLDLLFDRLRKG